MFSRNPVVLTGDAPQSQQTAVEVSLQLGEGDIIFTGTLDKPYRVDVSEILDANAGYFPEVLKGKPVSLVESLEQMQYETGRYCTAMIDAAMKSFYVIPGGVSKQNFRRYLKLDTDAFAARFLNPKNNFFLTTRTTGWRIVLKETELYPLYFISPEKNAKITVIEAVSKSSIQYGIATPGVYCLNLDYVRRHFLSYKDVLPSVFDIRMGVDYSCRIVIEKTDVSKERYRLKYRNSLGIFEIMEITGELSLSPDYPGGDESTFQRYDDVTGDFYTERERIARNMVVTVATGVKRADEIRMMMDMIGSDDVYLMDLTPEPVRVIPSVEDMKFGPRPETPQTFDLKLEMADTESNIMQDILDGTEGRKPRVFSKQFTKQFN